MAGQSAALSLKEARAMQMRIQHSGSHAQTHGGKKHGSGMKTSDAECSTAHHQAGGDKNMVRKG